MVIVMMASNPKDAGALARRLAVTLAWPCVDASSTFEAAREAVARAHDRREHIVLRSSRLSRSDHRQLVHGIAQVRIVLTTDASASGFGWDDADALLAVDAASDPDDAIRVIRDALGV